MSSSVRDETRGERNTVKFRKVTEKGKGKRNEDNKIHIPARTRV